MASVRTSGIAMEIAIGHGFDTDKVKHSVSIKPSNHEEWKNDFHKYPDGAVNRRFRPLKQ